MKPENIRHNQPLLRSLAQSITALLVAMLLLTGCSKDMTPGEDIRDGIEVSVNLSLLPDVNVPFANPLSRSGTGDPMGVDDVWVLQFDKNDILRTPARYYTGTEDVRLLSGTNQRIFVLANSGQKYLNFKLTPGLSTYADIVDMAADANAAPVTPFTLDDPPEYLPMEGCAANLSIDESGTPVTIKMAYCVAKIEVTISNHLASGLTITGVQLCGVPTMADMLVIESKYSEADTPVVFPEAVRTNKWENYPLKSLDMKPDDASVTYAWYVPRNERGPIPAITNTDPMKKALYAQFMGTQIITTSIEVTALTDGGVERSYRFLAGANAYNDLNIKPSCLYKATLNFQSPGEVGIDMRIVEYRPEQTELVETIDYVKDKDGHEITRTANCYILNPPVKGKRIYLIPINRGDDYWTPNTNPSGYQTPESQQEALLYRLNQSANGQGFGSELIWQDAMDMVEPRHIVDGAVVNIGGENWTDNSKICITRACGPYETDRTKNYIEITVPAGAKRGNFLIGVYKAGLNWKRIEERGFSWSFHFWVTDYNPDAPCAPAITPGQPGQFVVPGGNVHRYAGTAASVWSAGKEYVDKVIMDRNLGMATAGYPLSASGSTISTANDLIGTFYYQWGRKDPFPAHQPVYDENNSLVTIQSATGPVTLNEAVKNPTTQYTSLSSLGTERYWALKNGTTNTPYEPGNLYWWGDEKVSWITTSYAPKTFFDPSPYGWKIPRTEATDAINTTGAHNCIADQVRFPKFADVLGAFYWPVGNVNGVVYYPAIGYIDPFRVSQAISTIAYTWTAAPSTSNPGNYGVERSLTATGAGIGNGSRCNAFSIRCIQE